MPIIKGLVCITVFTMHGLNFLILTFQDCVIPIFQMRKWVGRGYVIFPRLELGFKPRLAGFSTLVSLYSSIQPPLKENEKLVFQKDCFPVKRINVPRHVQRHEKQLGAFCSNSEEESCAPEAGVGEK